MTKKIIRKIEFPSGASLIRLHSIIREDIKGWDADAFNEDDIEARKMAKNLRKILCQLE